MVTNVPKDPPGSPDVAPARPPRGARARSGRWPACSGAAAAGARLVWDKGGFDVVQSSAARQVRDYRVAERDAEHAEFAIARAPTKETGDDSPDPDGNARAARRAAPSARSAG